ncbi:gamma-soluble nsf attachment protein, putative [Perkinsus marinus ATCC 50983]|uniref:Gamma-soluble NSF attachment protein n=1 Tax=Perkinsus marinus (strain ATCC 50983 / TXsc) TaxID=423536 RepID=C5LMS6_PERM5|nr:gamma-soluble nsf attachment protein, putative [Perkinsus marinus ATCC 50983]EER01967.1 gamma-soluble nsf attachment protein, putative [Perkinsus marinus ATCC 50983]|eukprot:XP_002769249.1 gamma-soluble nsf attachment protein, putative [Perkinsus marinus ATCC 50983]
MSMVEEARDHFSPDYLVAALELSQAAACFQSASLNDQAAKAWLKAAELRKTNLRDFQGAARNFESAGQLMHNPEHYKSAADSYLAAGKADQAARAWTRVAGILAKTDPEGATDAYRKVVDIYRADGDVKHGGNAYALEALRVYQDWLLSRHELEKWLEASKESSTLLEAAGLYASTHKELLARVNGFLASEEMAAGEGMVIAYRNNDAEALQDAVNKNCVKFLPIEIVKIAKSLKVAELPSPSPSPGGNPGPENDATDAAEPTPEGLGALLL